MSTTKGRTYEYIVRDFCVALGIRARRRKLSGSDLKKPYDVKLIGMAATDTDPALRRKLFPVFIEAKRRMFEGDAITLEKDWIDRIGVRNIVVFAVGRHPGRPMRHYCICQPQQVSPEVHFVNELHMKKYMKVKEEQVENKPAKLYCGDKIFCIVTFEYWLRYNGYMAALPDKEISNGSGT